MFAALWFDDSVELVGELDRHVLRALHLIPIDGHELCLAGFS